MLCFSVIEFLGVPDAWVPLFIFCARIIDVSIGTVRMICLTRDQRWPAVILGFFEVLVWVLAVSSVLTKLDNPLNILAFAGGFASGSAIGMFIERKLAMGTQMVTLMSSGVHNAVAERLRFAGLLVTTLQANGREGPVSVSQVVVPRKQAGTIIKWAKEIDSAVWFAVNDIRESPIAQPCMLFPGKIPVRPLGFAWPFLIGRLRRTKNAAPEPGGEA